MHVVDTAVEGAIGDSLDSALSNALVLVGSIGSKPHLDARVSIGSPMQVVLRRAGDSAHDAVSKVIGTAAIGPSQR